MAYSLRYWYNNKLTDGKVIRLEIYKKDSAAAAMEIGDVVQGLSLNIDGGEDNIDAPIVSTSLVMTFCDAYDHPEAEVKKCGNYAEFYTPDATLWKVVLLCKDKGASSFRTLWGGYVTPDSYEEDLTYRGSVTIVARDNIGHMADFPFDAEGDGYGTISFREIIEGAWAKIESPMSLVFHDEWMQTEGVSALDTRMNVSAFEDKSWHEAVEAALYAYGAVLRFIGDNKVKVSPLRYMPNYGGSVMHSEPVFMTGATRMLTPAVKRIEETASYELEAGAVIPKIEASDYTGETGTYRCKIDGIEIDGETFSTNEHDAPIWPISTLGFNDWYNGALATTLFFNVDAYDVGYFSDYRGLSDEIKRYMYIAANQVDARFVRVYKAMQSSDFVIKMQFGKPVRLNREYELEQSYGSFNLKEITYAITMEQNGVTTYYHGGDYWSATRKELRISFDATKENSVAEFPVAIGQNIGDALFCFEIVKIEYAQVGPSNETYGLYACIQSLSFDVPENISLLQTNRVNTNYNEENNVIITRDPAIAPAYNTTFLPSVIKNGIFYAEGLAYKPAKAWAFAGDTPQQMAVYNHLQLLAYYAKPNNVIEGSIVNGDVSRFAHIWQFEGKEHILVSGRYNFISGYIEGAILREFARYESLWGSTGGTQLPATETSNDTNVEASASSSSSANTYENITTVSIGMGGGGSSYLRDLLDVDVSASVKGSILCYNGQQWVDKTLQMIVNELKQLGDWFYKTEDGKSIGTKYNLFSEGEMSANGLNLGGGTSGGGGLIQNVLGKSSFGTVASEDNATTFNAYAIDSLYKRIVELEGKDVEVDLSDYYTKQQTQNAITTALSPYIKATDADGKYAALASFNALQSSFDRLYSALNDDTSGVINTWNEVVDFVNEYSGSEDLSTILGKMNTDINARVKVSDFDTWKTDVFNPLSVTVTNLGKKVDTNTANINKLLGWFNIDADGNLFTTYNFYSTKEISANGISQGTGGGGSGLISSVLSATSLGATLANDNSVVFNAYATNEIYKATQGHASRIGVLESQVGQLTTQGTKVSVSDLLTTGTKIATITVDGVAHEVKGDFLPTNGGTISGTTSLPLTIAGNSTSYVGLGFKKGSNADAYIVHYGGRNWAVTSEGWAEGWAMLHSGNYSQYALPLTGGLMKDAATIQWGNNKCSWDNVANGFIGISNTSEDDSFGYYAGLSFKGYYGLQLRTFGGRSSNLAFRGFNATNWGDWKTIAFTDSNVASATKLATARTIWGQSFDGTGNVSGNITGSNFLLMDRATNPYLQLTDSLGTVYFQIVNGNAYMGSISTKSLMVDGSGNVGIGTTNPQYKLDVNGDAAFASDVYIASGKSLILAKDAEGIYVGNDGVFWHNAANIWTKTLMVFNENGNVLIGTTTDTGYKLDVNGTLRATDAVTFGSTLTIAGATTHNGIAYFGGTTYYINTSGNAHFNAISGSSLQVDSAAFNGTIHSNEYSGNVAKWSITNDGAASFASLSNGGLLETSTLRVSSTSTFTGKTNHNGGIGAAWVSISGTLEVGTTSTFTGKTTHNCGIKATDIETGDFLATGDAKIYGELRLQKGSNANGNYLYFGDGSFCYLHEENDDRLTIYAQKGLVTKAATGTAWDSITKENWIDDNSAHTRFVNNYNALAIIIDKDSGASYRRAAIQVGDTSNNVGTLYLNPKGGEVHIASSGVDTYVKSSLHVGSILYASTIYAGSTLYLQANTITNQAEWWTLSATGDFYTLGNIAAEGEISANALNQGSDIRFKHQLGDISLDLDTIANAPMFRFTWTNKENSRVQIGTSAQYWKDSARELVSVDKDDFHRLDYATLGVLIGVTLGKTVKNHEDRIKELEMKVESLETENRRLRYGN